MTRTSGNSARDQILARITTALGQGRPIPPIVRNYRTAGSQGPGDVERFADRLRDYRAHVRIVPPTASRPRSPRRWPNGRDPAVAAPGIPVAWAPDITREPADLPTLAQTDAVVTACCVAIADTGTIILDHDAADQAPRTDAGPDYHLVVVRRDQVVAGVPDAVAALAGCAPRPGSAPLGDQRFRAGTG